MVAGWPEPGPSLQSAPFEVVAPLSGPSNGQLSWGESEPRSSSSTVDALDSSLSVLARRSSA